MKENPMITKEVMEQYEQLRSLGPCNMFDYYCVIDYADELELHDLASLERDDYVHILSNFTYYMKKYNIKQD